MDKIYSNYLIKFKKVSDWNIVDLTWNISNKMLIVFTNNIPFGVFEIKIIGEVRNEDILWAWKTKANYIDKEFYPKGLKKKIKNIIGNGNNLFIKTIIALDVLNGIWYIHLHDDSIEKIAIITKIIKIYK
jgi:hypothetical protein